LRPALALSNTIFGIQTRIVSNNPTLLNRVQLTDDNTDSMQFCLDRLVQGDATGRAELLRLGQERLRKLAARMLRRFPDVSCWEQADDVLQILLLRIDHLFGSVQVATVDDYMRLARKNLREILLDLDGHYNGPRGHGTTHLRPGAQASSSKSAAMQPELTADLADDPAILAELSEFHEQVRRMPTQLLEVFELLFYRKMPHKKAARLLHLSMATLDRRWQAGKKWITERMGIPPF
jgi:DNA-directed RNA polymerase specialized sigma24 family protein